MENRQSVLGEKKSMLFVQKINWIMSETRLHEAKGVVIFI